MKKFTFLLLMVLAVSTVFAQPNSQFIEKTEQTQNALQPLIEASNLLLKQSEAKNYLMGENKLLLKNALATQKLDSAVYMEREPGETEWKYVWKEEYHWDASQQTSTWIENEWDETSGSFFVSSQTITEFNNEGTIEVIYSYYRFEPGDDLLLEGRMEPVYDNSGRLESIKYYASEDDGETWFLEMEVFYSYNNSGQLIETVYWTLEDEELLQSMRLTYSYNEAGERTMSQTYYMMEGEEILFAETQNEYDNSGRLTSETDWSLNYTTFQLTKSSRITTEYNATGEVSVEIYYDWDDVNEVWLEVEKDEYSYTATNMSDVLYLSTFFMYDFMGFVELTEFDGKAVAEIAGYTWVDDDWLHAENQVFYYSSINASNVELTENNDFAVFPNPATDNAIFTWSNDHQQLMLEIFKVDGAKMLERRISSGQNIQLKNLESGIYLYHIKTENETLFSGKLVKQ
ncbi:Por secretion system C-terminal sorting domain-containing protein [Tangfeifania diversioriginum]|uniref:Por secretion system C-terminal sorting domain-containing protein n=1 Tax=Tangfeifania diversioriginum TaxID=1168035 RepID=A0A1M6E6L3_9BACT|nr:T9SS type A sorting domain-containing protein [Tangfeifania diversioriginum]SHI81137.1 Por secretion system C-terminal sorting domain-containing protein [Tangfeifania diversioriginum]